MLDNDLQVPSLISDLQQIASKDPQQEGFSFHGLRPHMLPPATTLHVHAGQFQGLLGAMEAFAAPGCTWKNWRSRNQLFEMLVPSPVDSIELPADGTSW